MKNMLRQKYKRMPDEKTTVRHCHTSLSSVEDLVLFFLRKNRKQNMEEILRNHINLSFFQESNSLTHCIPQVNKTCKHVEDVM